MAGILPAQAALRAAIGATERARGFATIVPTSIRYMVHFPYTYYTVLQTLMSCRGHPEQALRCPTQPPGRRTRTVRSRSSRTTPEPPQTAAEVDAAFFLEATPSTPSSSSPVTTATTRGPLITLRGLRHATAKRQRQHGC
jgi:hypothetical protein